jgi:predicted O-methyltransferase YrrM
MKDIIYEKYKKELDYVKEIMQDKYLYNMWYNYGFTLKNKFFKLDSNINIYEACFISLLVNNYIKEYKNDNKKINILEIGLAYGTSSIVILNQLLNYKGSIEYDIIDPNQTEQWQNIGINHIYSYLNLKKAKEIKINLIQKYSQDAMIKLRKKYDIIFIDGSHDNNIVIQDLINSDRIIKKDGLIIVDDVLHTDVKNALIIFAKEKRYNYKRTILRHSTDSVYYLDYFNINDVKTMLKKNILNPSTMFCYQKII